MASAHQLPLALDRCLREGFFTTPDPGASGTISIINKGKAICAVETAGAESRALPAAAGFGIGTELLVYANSLVGDLTVTGADGGSVVLGSEGDHVEFIVVGDDNVRQWNARGISVANTVTAAVAFGTDELLLMSDGTGRGAQATAIAIDDLTDLIEDVQGTFVHAINLGSFVDWDSTTEAHLGATPNSADDWAFVLGTFLTDASYLTSSSETPGDANPVTRYGRVVVRVPDNYQDGDALTLRCAWARPDAAATSLVLDAEVVRVAAPSADINSTAVVNINGAASGTANFVLTPTDIVAGELLNVRLLTTAVSNGASYEARVTAVSLVHTV